jgi:glutathione synthase
MRIVFIVDPLEGFKTYKDSSYAMMVEADVRGHQLFVCEQQDLSIMLGTVTVKASRLHLTGEPHAWYRLDELASAPLTQFDAVLMRKDPPFDMEYVYSTYLLERAQAQGARVFNDPRAIRDHNEKLSITEFGQFTAPTLVTRSAADLRAFVAEHGQAVFKLLDGMGGASIFRANQDDPNLSVIIETMNRFGSQSVMAQRYLPEIRDGDKRVLLIGGAVVPYCLARIPKAGESRGNLAAGGTGRAQPISDRDREIGEYLAPLLYRRGLLLVGLDVIGSCLTEINVTSPTCFQEITEQTGCKVAALFIDALETAVARPASALVRSSA